MTKLHIFALNGADPDLRHTHLTRALGETPEDLPPLADWLGLEALDTRDIELFPVRDLDDMSLSDYITAAFAPEGEIARADRARLDALGGSVLLVPDRALTGTPQPAAEASLIATLRLARPNMRADLPAAEVGEAPKPAPPEPERPRATRGGSALWVLLGLILAVIVVWVIF